MFCPVFFVFSLTSLDVYLNATEIYVSIQPNFTATYFLYKSLSLDCWTDRLPDIVTPRNHTNGAGLEDLTRLLFSCQLEIEVQQQSQKIPVGVDGSLLDQLLQSLFEREVMVNHEVRQHQGRRAAHSHDAVHQNLP